MKHNLCPQGGLSLVTGDLYGSEMFIDEDFQRRGCLYLNRDMPVLTTSLRQLRVRTHTHTHTHTHSILFLFLMQIGDIRFGVLICLGSYRGKET